ncbi:MAG TPA: endonuclease III domain-containing protein [Atribacterota bacterium]|nr:endonuclease III domain-containing protein [Atribacterota bacterium]
MMVNQKNSNELYSMHQVLLEFYGSLHWWPGESSLEIMVGAILTQNTNWQNVSKAIEKMKEEGLLEVTALFHMDEKSLGKIIKSCGYYNLKARRLKNFINFFYRNYGGSVERLFSVDWKILREELLKINGIGPETADSILLYAGNKPIFVVDAYTRRIFHRHNYFSFKASYQEIQHFFMVHLPQDHSVYNEFHAQLVMLGKDFCNKNNPLCSQCPLSPFLNKKTSHS